MTDLPRSNKEETAVKSVPMEEKKEDSRRRTMEPSPTQTPVVASVSKRSVHGYTAVSVSPNRDYAVTASHDCLQLVSITSDGLTVKQTIPIAPHLAAAATQVSSCSSPNTLPIMMTTTTATTSTQSSSSFQRQFHRHHHRPLIISEDLFEEPVRSSSTGTKATLGSSTAGSSSSTAATPKTSLINVVINDVAWSNPLWEATSSHNPRKQSNPSTPNNGPPTQSFIAASGSNGAIVVWREETLLPAEQKNRTTNTTNGGESVSQNAALSLAPEVVLDKHVRAVNRLAWHPKRQMLLSASHDQTVRLWERKRIKDPNKVHHKKPSGFSFPFFGGGGNTADEDTDSSVPLYSWQCTSVFEPKCESVRDIGWNPLADDIFALCTSSGCLVVYNRFVRARVLLKLNAHDRDATTLQWHPTRLNTIATGGSNDRLVKVWNLEHALHAVMDPPTTATTVDALSNHNQNTLSSVQTEISDVSTDSSLSVGSRASTAAMTFCSTSSYSRQAPEHVLAVAAPVKRVRWRPPANNNKTTNATAASNSPNRSRNTSPSRQGNRTTHFVDRHESMLAVATVPVKGESGGGSGFVALWSYHRPFMPLCIMEGHKEGAVTDLVWLDSSSVNEKEQHQPNGTNNNVRLPSNRGIWQHILSVGKDGHCLVQSLANGERPITNVPPSCFAMANLSPFQRGYGSLQIFSVSQTVNRDPDSWLRVDVDTESAPGIFRESASIVAIRDENDTQQNRHEPGIQSNRISHNEQQTRERQTPTITFHSVDHGDLDQTGKPVVVMESTCDQEKMAMIAPEVVHMSRFAEQYVLYPTLELPSRIDICLYNSQVAETLRNPAVSHMWHRVAEELEKAEVDSLADQDANETDLASAILEILEERADDGDVQSCVAVCEVLEIVNSDRTTQIPFLEIQLVREWYLSYIDLLRNMCLFTYACDVIRNCKDPFVAAQNKHSTSIAESCQMCGKPILADRRSIGQTDEDNVARRMCKTCKRTIGMCSICHEPVRGMYIWCPGCGHGKSKRIIFFSCLYCS